MYYFNPDNDLALANFSTNYTPPASAIKIAEDLSVLPAWYALESAKIITNKAPNQDFLDLLKMIIPTPVSFIEFSEIVGFPNREITPWGWNPALTKKLSDIGLNEQRLPSMDELKQLRHYSGRQNAVRMLREIKEMNSDFCGESIFFENQEMVLEYLSVQKEDSVLKMPYSGSGKGLMWIRNGITDKQTDWCRKVIRSQGGIVVEPVLNKTIDFAMEFKIENHETTFAGYSLFKTLTSGAYIGNYLLSDKEIENRLKQYVSIESLIWLQKFYIKKLTEFFPNYKGCIGVDMMICETSSGYKIQPCVEINMRMNMGMVARIFYDRYISPTSSGIFVVDYLKKSGEAYSNNKTKKEKYPLKIKEGKIEFGYFPLTPVFCNTNYVAYVIIDSNITFE